MLLAWCGTTEFRKKEAAMPVTISLSASSRHYLSISHLSAAALFSKRAAALESVLTLGDPASNDGIREHNACVVTSVMLSVAFLEATINELWADCHEGFDSRRLQGIQGHKVMAALWKSASLKRATMLEKYELVLELNAKPELPKGTNPYQGVKLLVELRNALVHYEPETILNFSDDLEKGAEHKFEKKLRGLFEPNKLMTGAGNPFYPDKVLGAGCAGWAVASAVAFADAFFDRLGISSTYQKARTFYGV